MVQWYQPNARQQSDRLHYEGFAGAMASFFQTGDPNALKLTALSVPEVPPLSSHKEYVITETGFTTLDYGLLEERCNFWKSIGPKIPI